MSTLKSLFLKKYRTSQKVELTFENVEDLSVRELRESSSNKLGIPLEELKLVYGGRVLKVGKTLGEYRIVSGCTVFAMVTKTTKHAKERQARRRSGGGLMNNRRVLTLIGRVLSNPALLQEMVQGIEMGSGAATMFQLLGSQQILASLSDPDNIRQYIQGNPDIGAMMEHIIKQFLLSNVEGSLEEQDEEQLVDLLESQLEEEMAQVEEEGGEAQLAQAQEQMFEHSQALHAHSQQQREQGQAPTTTTTTTTTGQQESGYNPLTSQQHGQIVNGPITQDQLASALASAMSTNQPQVHRSASDYSQPPPSYTAMFGNAGVSSQSQQQQQQQRRAGGGAGGGATAGPISAAALQQALASMVGSRDERGAPDGQAGRQGSGGGAQSDRTRYFAQLEQLRLMGITDETACLHALAATGGDLQAALEILYSQ